MSGTRKKLLTRIILALLALWIAGQALIAVVRYFNGRQARQEAEAWLQEAQDDAKPDMTPDDAVRWLQQHGVAKAYRGAKRSVNGQEMEWHAITGWRVHSR